MALFKGVTLESQVTDFLCCTTFIRIYCTINIRGLDT